MGTFSALLAICAGNSPVTGEFPARPVTRSFDVFFDLRQDKRLSKHLALFQSQTMSFKIHLGTSAFVYVFAVWRHHCKWQTRSRGTRKLTHLPLDKMEAKLQTIIEVQIRQRKLANFEISSLECDWCDGSNGLDNGLAPNRPQSITWTHDDSVQWP